jgi:hypothetical protein
MRSILVMLIAAVLLAMPALAFELTGYDFSTIEAEDEEMVKDSGTYTFERVVVDENGAFSPQDAYSGLIFGVAEGDQFDGKPASTAAIVANKIDTAATGVTSDVTRQFMQQKGSAYVLLTPEDAIYDPETPRAPETTVNIGFKKSNLAWVSGDLKEFTATPVSYAVAGGNWLDAVPDELSPNCNNVWLYEQEQEVPISVKANGESRLLDAYVGSASNANLVMIPSVGTAGTSNYVPATAKMSGYAERFGGYTNAFVDAYSSEFPGGVAENSIDIDFNGDLDADQIVSHYWGTGEGIALDEPECSDFPALIPVYLGGTDTGDEEEIVTWPNSLPEFYEPLAMYDSGNNLIGVDLLQ